jgi:putative glutamine amidotransferase
VNNKPVIGIAAQYDDQSLSLKHDYVQSIVRAGGVPVVLPFLDSREDIDRLVRAIDGLMVTGGPDIDPQLYGEEPIAGLGRVSPERDRSEYEWITACLELNKPVLGVCRGHQMLNVVCGGSLYQDLPSQCQVLQHFQQAPRSHLSHTVQVEQGTLLDRLIGKEAFTVNSFHHQAVKQPAPGFRVSATSKDGVIEAIESLTHPFAVGVQWHPEDTSKTDAPSQLLFAAFVGACGKTE